jgi:glutathione S-transferase
MNPNRLIPVMKDGDLVLFESMAICQYIAKKLGGSLAGQDIAEEARMNMFGFWAMTSFEPNILPMVFGEDRTEYMKKLQSPLQALNNMLEGVDYLVGNRFTVADVMMASVVGQYGRAIKFDFSPWPNVKAWVNLTTKRKAFYPPRNVKVNPKGSAPKSKL